jgi:DNA-directed RNA polymerase specialized sigma24 family protein
MKEDDVTVWLRGLAEGDQSAVRRIWEQYHDQLVRLARRKLGRARRRAADEEDIALSAFNSFCQRATAGRFPRLEDHYDLWKLLVTITARKAMGYMRREGRQKRGGAAVRGESAFARGDVSNRLGGIGQVLGREPTPAIAAQVAEETERLLSLLGDGSLRDIALLKLEGCTNEEIARHMDCALRTVKRRLAYIRQKWQPEVEP